MTFHEHDRDSDVVVAFQLLTSLSKPVDDTCTLYLRRKFCFKTLTVPGYLCEFEFAKRIEYKANSKALCYLINFDSPGRNECRCTTFSRCRALELEGLSASIMNWHQLRRDFVAQCLVQT